MPIVSLHDTVVRLNGHTVGGWAKQADALMFPDIDIAQYEIGPDGLMVVSATGIRGGEVTLKLQSNSPSRAFMQQQFEQQKNGAEIEWTGTVSNARTGETTRLERGAMIKGPAAQTLGDGVAPAREFVIVFESILNNADSLRSDTPPVRANLS